MAESSYVVLGATGWCGALPAPATRGARLTVAARDCQRTRALAAELGAHPVPIDATCAEHVERCFSEALERHGRVDGVANCVGSLLLKPAHLTTDDE
jgi:NAD(P)-dependent dehydrogenase (short-subunit alcohol dehydrogenase family)